jgi:hypothetical protein
MKSFGRVLSVSLALLVLSLLLGSPAVFAQEGAATKAPEMKDVNPQELAATVPALGAFHKVIYPLWHQAYPDSNYAMIKELLPQADTLVAALDKAPLPGILRDKQAAWDAGKADLKETLMKLHAAADADDHGEMLKQTEAFHAGFEQLVRTTRPAVPELEAFHQELYKLYHYYMPSYDLEKIRVEADAMSDKMAALRSAKLPKRLADREEKFRADVTALDASVAELKATVKTDAKEKIKAAVEKVHTAYQEVEKLFD